MTERQNAETVIIKDLQRHAYQNEIETLSKGKQHSKNDKMYNLDVFLDKDNVLKVGGRVQHSSLPSSFKHPTIIPREHHITKLIIAHCHERVNHQGKGFTMNEIRSNGYWIPKLSQTVASYIRRCVFCRKQRRPVEGQKMRDLPTERFEQSPPFTYCGMDVFGPFLTKQARKEYKRASAHLREMRFVLQKRPARNMKTSTPLPPPGQFVKEDLYAQKQWRQIQYLLEQFWSRWKKEYLQNIMVRQKWHKPKKKEKKCK